MKMSDQWKLKFKAVYHTNMLIKVSWEVICYGKGIIWKEWIIAIINSELSCSNSWKTQCGVERYYYRLKDAKEM